MEISDLVSEILSVAVCGVLDVHQDEILLSSDKTIAVIDGSGVLADPVGINREELIRLAKLRLPVAHFNKAKLSHDGYLVKIEEQDVKLPCESHGRLLSSFFCLCAAGEVILDGMDFRNGAHLRFKADLFVPCGGR
jgi:glutamate dehydrogenase